MENDVKTLLKEIKTLTTYEHVIAWNKRAKDLMENLGGQCRDLDLGIQDRTRQLEVAIKEFEAKSFFAQLFAGRRKEFDLLHDIRTFKEQKMALEKMISDLQRNMASTL